jgi:hypothetical protein
LLFVWEFLPKNRDGETGSYQVGFETGKMFDPPDRKNIAEPNLDSKPAQGDQVRSDQKTGSRKIGKTGLH